MLRLMRAVLLLGCCLAATAGDSTIHTLRGTLRMRGSDSMDPLLRLWASEFQKNHPNVQLDIESHGSATAPPALLEGKADLGHMSRDMKPAEQDAFLARFGNPPTRITVAFDALAIFVHKDNPIRRLTTEQLDAIYSLSRKGGWEEPLTRWGDLYLRNPLKRLQIHPWSRDERSGTRAFFQEKVLTKDGIWRGTVQIADQMGILDAVAADPSAIGYGPAAYASPGVRVVPLATGFKPKACLPTSAHIQEGAYPLSRRLSICFAQPSGATLPPLARAFLEYALSKEGQELVARYGSVPLSEDARRVEISKLR